VAGRSRREGRGRADTAHDDSSLTAIAFCRSRAFSTVQIGLATSGSLRARVRAARFCVALPGGALRGRRLVRKLDLRQAGERRRA